MSVDKPCESFKLHYNGSKDVDHAEAKLGIHTYVGTRKDRDKYGVFMSFGKEKVTMMTTLDEDETIELSTPGWNGWVKYFVFE